MSGHLVTLSHSLTLTGRFGDYSPGKAFEGFQDDPVAFMKMCFTVVYCIFGRDLTSHCDDCVTACAGMTLISMCMNLMQEQIAEKVSWIAEELGMKGDGNDEEVVKLSREVRTATVKLSIYKNLS